MWNSRNWVVVSCFFSYLYEELVGFGRLEEILWHRSVNFRPSCNRFVILFIANSEYDFLLIE